MRITRKYRTLKTTDLQRHIAWITTSFVQKYLVDNSRQISLRICELEQSFLSYIYVIFMYILTVNFWINKDVYMRDKTL